MNAGHCGASLRELCLHVTIHIACVGTSIAACFSDRREGWPGQCGATLETDECTHTDIT